MIEYLADGSTEYKISEYLKSFLNSKVNQPVEKRDIITPRWREILDIYQKGDRKGLRYIRDIIGGGQSDFDQEFNGFTPKEKVLLYCYRNFEQHLVSQMYIFENHTDIFKQYISTSHPSGARQLC